MSDLDLDLDSLLTESVKLADARKAAKKGAKLSAEQQALLETNRIAEEMELWLDVAVYAHMQESLCNCGNCYKDFQGFYLLQRRRFGKADRLLRIDTPPEGLEVWKFETYQLSSHCYECVEAIFSDAPEASPQNCQILSSLGKTAKPWVEYEERTPIQFVTLEEDDAATVFEGDSGE